MRTHGAVAILVYSIVCLIWLRGHIPDDVPLRLAGQVIPEWFALALVANGNRSQAF
jgi:hypothetical protein